MTNFQFLKTEWPEICEAAVKAEELAHSDPRTACFQARRALELLVYWVYENDLSVNRPYQDNLSALIHEPTFIRATGQAVFTKARIIKDLGNRAVHERRNVPAGDAVRTVTELFHVGYWLARTYALHSAPDSGLRFNPALLPQTTPIPSQTREQLQRQAEALAEKDTRLSKLRDDLATLDEELAATRREVAVAKAANTAVADDHDYSENETRDYFIDLLLNEAGWELNDARDREFEVTGMPNAPGVGYVDYVLWGNDGKPLAVVEAKRTKRDPRVGQQQAKLYADCLELKYGQRPVIFYSNGYEHWLWDDALYPPRQVQGFLKKDELELMIQRRETRRPLGEGEIDQAIVERFYQTRAIRRIGESFEKDNLRKALVVMATGAGKTRTVIALCDLLMRCNWAKRVLFLADRVALVNQAANAFKVHLPASAPVNLVTDKTSEGRIYVSTYPTMIRLIDEARDGQRKFGVGHFDVVIIDEAHRSVYQKYRAIFEYFDSLLIGLTATPKDEVDKNTYSLFDLETGVPTDAYGLEDAVSDGFLVPPKSVSVPLKFIREGITYDELSEDEQAEWDAKEWDEDGEIPDRVDAGAVNKWLFNRDTVDKVLKHLMTHGQTVADGDRLGKTIVFAKNNHHAEFIAERFNTNYPHYKGEFARVITYKTEYAQSLIDDFSIPGKAPHIAISVDMLDTGIDVPEVLNLVFFKQVFSKTKFWQMLGRGTRLCQDIFGKGRDKQFFHVFDYCQNLEYFSQNPEATDGATGESLSKRLFVSRLEIINELAPEAAAGNAMAAAVTELRQELLGDLRDQVAAMNMDNFIVRTQRRTVEKYQQAEAWEALGAEEYAELAIKVAGLPSGLVDNDVEAKRFDLLMFRLQLSVLRAKPGFVKLRDQVINLAGLLEEMTSIPMIRQQLELIQAVQTDEWWQDVTPPLLDQARKKLRGLINLIEIARRPPIYTDFTDQLGDEVAVDLPGFAAGVSYERFRDKARVFLREHEDHIAIRKIRENVALNQADISELEQMLRQAGVATEENIHRAVAESKSLGLFIRSLVGLDREAAKAAFGVFLSDTTATANQIEFINMIIDHLTEHGVMDPGLLYASPYTDINPQGPEGVFSANQIDVLVSVLEQIRHSAAA